MSFLMITMNVDDIEVNNDECMYNVDNNNNKTISDGGITVDFTIIKVHTSN